MPTKYVKELYKMSGIPDVIRRLNEVSHTSIVVPVQQQVLPNPDTSNVRVYMDHPRLPTMQEFNFYGWYTAMGHNLNNEFVYECYGQDYSGFFHLIGQPGLFSVGMTDTWLNEYSNPQSQAVFTLNVNRRGQPGNNQSISISSAEHKLVFLGSNDSIYFEYNPSLNNDLGITVGSNTEVAITRVSRNPLYVTPTVIYDD